MKKPALIALIMVLGLSGCASSGTTSSTKQDWTACWWNRGGPSCELIRQDWIRYWNNPGGASWESVKLDWIRYWNNPGGASWESVKEDWIRYWGCSKSGAGM